MPSILSWTFALSRLFGRQPLLAYEPRQTPPWSLFDIFMTVMFMIALQGIALMLFGAAGPTRLTDTGSAHWTIVIAGVASLIACALGASLIVLRTNANWGKDLGLTLRHAGRDVVYGIVAFAMLAPIIYLIQLILVQWYPSKHPLVESFRADPTLSFYLVCVFSAAFVAPIVEEFICRMLLQGWLERVLGAKSLKNALFSLPDMAVRQGETGEAAATNSDMPPIETNEAKSAEELNAPDPAADAPGVLGGAVPIVFSSLVFATLHWNHGPDPIPLFILAIGLGYLYQRTHRILPCVVLHFLVNAFSLAMLALSLVVE
jgi:membrane protease YdiL (CAAX protease family)